MQETDQASVALRAIMRKQIEQAYIDKVACGMTDFVVCVVQEDSSTIWIGTPTREDFVELMKRLGRPEAARLISATENRATYWLFVVSLSGAELSRPVF